MSADFPHLKPVERRSLDGLGAPIGWSKRWQDDDETWRASLAVLSMKDWIRKKWNKIYVLVPITKTNLVCSLSFEMICCRAKSLRSLLLHDPGWNKRTTHAATTSACGCWEADLSLVTKGGFYHDQNSGYSSHVQNWSPLGMTGYRSKKEGDSITAIDSISAYCW